MLKLWIIHTEKYHSQNRGFYFLETTPIFQADLPEVPTGIGFYGHL